MSNKLYKHDSRGRFAPGTCGGPGNPLAPKVAALKSALLNAISPDDVAAAVRRLVDLCHDPDRKTSVEALRLFFDRVFGKPVESVAVDVQKDEPRPVPWQDIRLSPEETALALSLVRKMNGGGAE